MTAPSPVPGSDLLEVRLSVPAHVVHRSFPAETVMLNLQTGLYHGLNPVAGRMLAAVERHGSPAAAIAALKREFPDAGERLGTDVLGLCEALVGRGLLRVDEEQSSP